MRFFEWYWGCCSYWVSDNGKIIGQHVTDNTKQEIARMLKRIEPFPQIDIDYIVLPNDDKQIIVLTAKHNNHSVPYIFDGRAYQRIQSTTSLMPQEQYQSLLLERIGNHSHWELLPANKMTVHDLDENEILRTIQEGIVKGRIQGKYTTDNPKKALVHLKLLDGDKPTNAAVVLFAKDVLPHYAQCLVRLARFRGVTKTEFIDNQQEFGNLFYLLDAAMEFIRRHMPVAGKVEEGKVIRTDTPLIPIRAVREAIINALCHRDYTLSNRSVSVGIYDDRLEITSPGKLPQQMTIEKLKTTHDSCPRNKAIANVLFRRGMIEQWGSGTREIIDECVEAGIAEPEFVEDDNTFIVRFNAVFSPARRKKDKKSLTDRQKEILNLLKRYSPLSVRELSEKMANPPTNVTIRKYLLKLQERHLVKSTGRSTLAKWEIVE